MSNNSIHTRIAPSPTGVLHIGTARTALVNFLIAKKMNGTFSIRIEDTDKERSKVEFEKNILDGLLWLGLTHDTLVRQSENLKDHIKAIDTLIAHDKAYESREESTKNPGEFVTVVRLRNPGTTITFTDLIRGEITFDTTELEDFVIARSRKDPLYHLAVVVDDHTMGISHVIRGEDHISNTPRQILIQEALGYRRPVYAHLPLILGPDRSKMSKRHGAVSIDSYKHEGYLPEALINYFALLGWHPEDEQEIFTPEELVDTFSIERIQKGGAIFSEEKLRWVNKQHMHRLPDDIFMEKLLPFLPKEVTALPLYSTNQLRKIIPVLKERLETFGDIEKLAAEEDIQYFFATPTYTKEEFLFKGKGSYADVSTHLKQVRELLGHADYTNAATVKESIWNYAEEAGRGTVLWPLRYALSGQKKSADPFTIAAVIGPEETNKRITRALAILSR